MEINENSSYEDYRQFITDLYKEIYDYRSIDDFLANYFFLETHHFDYLGTRYYTYRNPHDLKYRYVTTKEQYKIFLELFLNKVKTFRSLLNNKEQETVENTRKLSELRGLGKEIWEGVDIEEYLDRGDRGDNDKS